MSVIETGEYLNWPRVKITTITSFRDWENDSSRREASQRWLLDNNVEYVDTSIHVSYLFRYRYIKDPNHLLIFRLKFPELCCDHIADDGEWLKHIETYNG